MLNTFPDLLNLSFIAPLILRIFVGSYFLKQSWEELNFYRKGLIESFKLSKILETLGGILLIIGFLTQVTSLFLILITVFNIVYHIKNRRLNEEKLDFYIIILGILISLIITGAGFMAIDMPL